MYKKGFTLMEMLFVLVIAATIVAFAVPAYKRSKERAKYEAATGILMDLGSGTVLLLQDMHHYPGSASSTVSSFLSFNSFYHMPKSAVGLDPLPSGKTIKQFILEDPAKKFDHFASAMFNGGYIEPFDGKTDYEFYLNYGYRPEVCNNKCWGQFCMCLPDDKVNADNACFYGAKMGANDKTITRIKHASCPN